MEHEFVRAAAAMADRVIVYEGTPGVDCVAGSPGAVEDGFNKFLLKLNVTVRQDPDTHRPRINKKSSRAHKLQKAKGQCYVFGDVECDDDNEPSTSGAVSRRNRR